MKKIGLICATALLGMSLTACGSQSTKKASSSSKTSSSKVVKHHKKANKHSEKKQESVSSSSSSVANSSNQQTTKQQPQANNSQQASSNNGNGQLPPSTDLHDFVNRYGESPAAYLSDHYGMSPEQAVQSVPNNMKSSGEIQDTYQLQQGQDPFNQ
ncbi:hypothetical protein L2724_05570 [Limosilactobacillus vaginalis]|uniref:Lipoprotein n=1 Tax=Limosilactobacillus vaginalis TaxID=1633 RepID=A0AAW5WTJ4_9LACO|nr:hypothetical protein [Limosilactobacillus vaginalis]MCZ3667753.1 hypothetical protein [Limosilactobacillus vaginalis]